MKSYNHKYTSSLWIKYKELYKLSTIYHTYMSRHECIYTHVIMLLWHNYLQINGLFTHLHLFLSHYLWLIHKSIDKLIKSQNKYSTKLLIQLSQYTLAQWCLYMLSIGYEMNDKIAIFTRVTLGFKSKYAVKRTDFYNCFQYWQTLQHIILHLCGHILFLPRLYHALHGSGSSHATATQSIHTDLIGL